MNEKVISASETNKTGSYYRHSDLFLDVAEVFHWGTNRHFQLWFRGISTKRHGPTERILRRLSSRGKLRSTYYGKTKIYSLPRKTKSFEADEWIGTGKIYHGLCCTECLVRFYRSRMDGVVIAEKYFRGFGSVPEWGILYPNGKLLLLEFSTKHNFFFSGNMKGKIESYRRNLEKIEKKFNAHAIVVFVIDVPRDTVSRFVGSGNGRSAPSPTAITSASPDGGTSPLLPLFFTDYKTFLNVPIGQALTAPIYIWQDGTTGPLTKDV